MVSDEEIVKPNRLAFLSEPLEAPLHISGTPVAHWRAEVDQTDTNFGAILVDYGTDTRSHTGFPAKASKRLLPRTVGACPALQMTPATGRLRSGLQPSLARS